MDKNNQELVPKPKSNLTRKELKKQRVDELLDSCKDEVIKQIIGPFGLTQAMFDDKEGGNVTTQHNAEQGVFANEDEKYNEKEYKGSAYRNARAEKLEEVTIDGKVTDAYTGKTIHGSPDCDHTVSMKEAHTNGGWRHDKEQRKKIGSDSENLHFTDPSLNRSKNDKDMKEWERNGGKERFEIDDRRTNPRVKKAKKAIDKHMPDCKEKVQYDLEKLALTGIEEAGRNALRQAMGLVLHELVNSSFIEVKRIANDQTLKENFVDHLIEAIRNVIEKIKDKAEHILKSVLSGGLQGFISNLLTFIINNIITTSAKIVTVIREGFKGLWEAIKLIMNPPKDMSGIDIARNASKIIATVITTSLGIVFEKSIEAFLLSIPVLAPLAPFISPVITGLLTGIVTALVVFAIDKLFDWFSENGTEILNAQIEHMEANVALFEQMAQLIESQFNNSKLYQLCIAEYNQIEVALSESNTYLNNAVFHAEYAVSARATTLSTMKAGFADMKSQDDELYSLLLPYEQNKKEI